ncbi:MAG: hypothetical protein IKU86_12235 [Thermoguttaceae bacterium]|nr:hypothetical protein [Thermoguttaceae bacterium]
MAKQPLGEAIRKLTSKLAQKLGGTATLVFGDGERVDVPFTPAQPSKYDANATERTTVPTTADEYGTRSAANVERDEISGTIPAADVDRVIHPENDYIVFNGEIYRITKVETALVQNQETQHFIEGFRD